MASVSYDNVTNHATSDQISTLIKAAVSRSWPVRTGHGSPAQQEVQPPPSPTAAPTQESGAKKESEADGDTGFDLFY